MNDQELDHAVARIALVTDDEIAEWIASADHDSALATLMTEPGIPDHRVVIDEPVLIERRASRSRWKVIGAGVAAAAVAAIAFVGAGIGERGDSGRVWAAPLVAFAEGSPLLLIDHDSWSITRAHDDGTFGEMTFSNGSDQADLRWQPASGITLGEERFSTGVNRGQYETPAGDVTVVEIPVSEGDATTPPSTLPSTLPEAAIVLKPIHFNAHWSAGDQAIELDGTVSTLNEFVDLLNRLKPVDVDTWLSAMPPSVIASIDQPAAVASLLDGVPVPAGFDAATLEPTADITDRYQLVARVAGAVACSWLDSWFTATENGDTASAEAAAAGLATSREWPMLLEIQSQGGFADQVWQWADAVNGGPGIITGGGPLPPSRELAVGGLGCETP